MIKTIRTVAFFSLFYPLFSCHSAKNLVGTYRSHFAEVGMFGTTVRLKPDSTLEYILQGDLMYDSATGHFHMRGSKIFVLFDPEPTDSRKLYYRYDDMPLRKAVYNGDTIPYKLLLFPGHNKLVPGDVETGKRISRAWGYSKRKKYVFFGGHYYNRRFYYRRVD